MNTNIKQYIKDNVNKLDLAAYEWFMKHSIVPRKIEAVSNLDTLTQEELWQITNSNSCYNIVFDKKKANLGLFASLSLL